MEPFVIALLILTSIVGLTFIVERGIAQKTNAISSPHIPKTWVDDEVATLELPLANAAASPKHISSEYYYRIPVRPIFKSYPIYAPGKEPPRYLERLSRLDPEITFDANVELLRAALEPTSAAGLQRSRLYNFLQAQHSSVKVSRCSFTSLGRGNLDVFDLCHLPVHTARISRRTIQIRRSRHHSPDKPPPGCHGASSARRSRACIKFTLTITLAIPDRTNSSATFCRARRPSSYRPEVQEPYPHERSLPR